MGGERLLIRNEFGSASVAIEASQDGTHVTIEDLESGHSVVLDPLMLASLVWVDETTWDSIVDPGRRAPGG